MSIPKPKLIPGMSFGDYCDLDAVNASTFLHLEGQTCAQGYYEITHPKDDRTSLIKGHAVHSAVLEPETFKTLYACEPKWGDCRVTANKVARDKWQAENAHKIPLSPDEQADAIGMRDALLANPETKKYLMGSGQNELTITWTDKTTKLRCKARTDRIGVVDGYQCLIDLKSGRNTSDFGVAKSLADYHYHIRMSWYRDALNLVHPAEWRVIFLWALNAPPYVTRITEMDEEWMDEGRAAYRTLLDTYAECKRTGYWPGHPAGVEVINPPPWARKYTSQKGMP